MKKITFVLITGVLLSGSVFAKEAGENLDNFKQKMVQHIDKEIAILTQLKTCIQAAQTPTAIESCKAEQKSAQNQLLLEMKKERLERRKKLLDMQTKKLNEALRPEKK